MAWADSYVAMMDGKYHYQFWRPVSAIRNGDIDGNDATARDPAWTSLIEAPLHPEYPSAHATLAGAVGAVVAAEVGPSPLPVLAPEEPPGIELNIAPTALAWVLRPDAEGVLHASRLRWGLVPRWSKEPATPYTTVTARLERAPRSRIFAQAWQLRRCIVAMSGYYKWDRQRKPPWPRFIQRTDGVALLAAMTLIFVAAVWALTAAEQQLNNVNMGQHFETLDQAMSMASHGTGVAIGDWSLIGDDLRAERLVMPFELKVKTGLAYYVVVPQVVKPRQRAVTRR